MSHPETIYDYGASLDKLPPKLREPRLLELVNLKDSSGTQGFQWLILRDKSNVIIAYAALLKKLTPEQCYKQLELLGVTRGNMGLLQAVGRANADTIAAYKSILDMLTPDQRKHVHHELKSQLSNKNRGFELDALTDYNAKIDALALKEPSEPISNPESPDLDFPELLEKDLDQVAADIVEYAKQGSEETFESVLAGMNRLSSMGEQPNHEYTVARAYYPTEFVLQNSS